LLSGPDCTMATNSTEVPSFLVSFTAFLAH
jgi:hypothetical protein